MITQRELDLMMVEAQIKIATELEEMQKVYLGGRYGARHGKYGKQNLYGPQGGYPGDGGFQDEDLLGATEDQE